MAETRCGFNDTATSSGSVLLTQYGPTLVVDIGFDSTYKPDAIPLVVPSPAITGVDALVDTGASVSCIDNLLAAQLGLPLVDKKPISGSAGSHMTNVYLAQIHVSALNFTIYGSFVGVDLAAGGQMHKALIGRDFLRNFTMTYEGKTGTVKISNN